MQRVDVAVIGAGITGLALGEDLVRRGIDARVVERADRAGGVVATESRDGIVLERGPFSLRGSSVRVADWLRRLDVAPLGADPAARKRYILRDGRLLKAPSLKLLSKRGWLRALAEPLVPRGGNDASLFELVARRFGREAARELLDPVIAGVFGGDPRELDPCVFPTLERYEAESGSILLGMVRGRSQNRSDLPRVMTVRGGLGTLVDRLVDRLGDHLWLGNEVERLIRRPDGWHLEGPDLVANRVAMCAPPAAAAAFLDHPGLSRAATAPLAAVSLAFPPVPLDGFGWLAPSHERRDVLGVIWVSSVFPDHAPGRSLVRVMIGGHRAPELVDGSDETLIRHARSILAEVQGISEEPELSHVVRVRPGIPQYRPGHTRWLEELATDGLDFLGWGYTGIGLVHCIETALETAQSLAERKPRA